MKVSQQNKQCSGFLCCCSSLCAAKLHFPPHFAGIFRRGKKEQNVHRSKAINITINRQMDKRIIRQTNKQTEKLHFPPHFAGIFRRGKRTQCPQEQSN